MKFKNYINEGWPGMKTIGRSHLKHIEKAIAKGEEAMIVVNAPIDKAMKIAIKSLPANMKKEIKKNDEWWTEIEKGIKQKVKEFELSEGRPKKPRYKCAYCGKMKKKEEFKGAFICKDCFPKHWKIKQKRLERKMFDPTS